VNRFHGCVEGDKLHLGDFSMEYPPGAHTDGAQAGAIPAVVYARPHLLEISAQPTRQAQFCARIARINAAGPVVKVELATGTGTLVQAEMSQERYRSLQVHKGSEVFVHLRDMQVFTAVDGVFGGDR
jgi:sulfate transport system ATP-binding protein